MKVLHLTLSKKPFEVMVTREKTDEFRGDSMWIGSRLYHSEARFGQKKHYDLVKFVNGYGDDKPYFIAEYRGFDRAIETTRFEYSNGLVVVVLRGEYIIHLGKIIETGNLK